MIETLYKLTDQDGYTRRGRRNETQWEPGWDYFAEGEGEELCTPGVIHAYRDGLVGLFLNPIHADIKRPRMFELRGEVVAEDWGKVGCKSVTCVRELPVPTITHVNHVAFGILAAKCVIADEKWLRWADDWLSGKDRSAEAAARAAGAAWAAAWAAVWAAGAARATAEAAAAEAAARAAWAKHPIDLPAIAKQAMSIK